MTSNKKQKTVLAVGADIKNRFLIGKGNNLRFGPDIGDLSDAENYNFFRKEIGKAAKRLKPSIIAYDLHPGYFSTKFATNYKLQTTNYQIIPIQHHHAHIASVIYEHNLKKPVIGVSFDGTGLGTDKNIWGGEFLLVDRKGFRRLAHFKYRMMPGAEKVIKEPWRMVLSILGKRAIPFIKNVKKNDIDMVLMMMTKNINTPLTSSVGRIFDAAAALVGICTYASYEAEGPIKLEAMCKDGVKESYDFKILKENGQFIIDVEPTFLGITQDLKKKDKRIISTKFHNTMVEIIVSIVKMLSKEIKIKEIALSGGVFQNRFLRTKTIEKLQALRFNVFINEKVPVNDLNIAVGQYYVSCNSGKS